MKHQIIKSCLLIFIGTFFSVCICFSQSGANWQIIHTPAGYYSEDVGVSTFTDANNGNIDKTGVTNSRPAIQMLLNQLGDAGGGTLYLSAGRYRIEGDRLIIPRGVTLRGDWKQPQKDGSAPVEGTILMAYHGRGSENEEQSFITMEPSTALYNVAIWYPDQTPANIVPYPPTIVYGRQGVWGNDYCNVRNVTLVNSYSGIVVSRLNGGGCPNIFNVYGSPLSRGIEIDNIADVGRFDWIDFSPDYWANSGLAGAPAKDGAHKKYIRENATAVVMRRNDWSYTCHLFAEGYRTGFHACRSIPSEGSQPNGHNYHLTFKDCEEAIRVDAVADAGMMFTRIRIIDCDNGIVIGNSAGSVVQVYDCDISASKNAIKMLEGSSLKLMTQQCTIHSGKIEINGGIYVSVDSDFNNATPQISTGISGRLLLSGNRFAEPADINERSLFNSSIDHTPVVVKPLPEFPEIRPRETKPARNALYVVTSAEFGAEPSTRPSSAPFPDAVGDNTTAIQNALNKAGSEGGGIVFLPPGKYRVNGNLTVPTGVELKGASDLASVPMAQGSIIEIYAGKDDPGGEPFLKLSAGSGIRGISFNYPEQNSNLAINPATLPQYPYCIQVMGADAYIVNVGVRATDKGIDLFTHKCDNHYVDYFAGHVFRNAMRIGGGSTNGVVSNVQFNSIVLSCGFEWPKFGGWPNSINTDDAKDAVYNQNYGHLEFMLLEDCIDQILYNNFHYASHKGIVFGANGTYPSGISMGLGLDASLRSICYEGLCAEKGFDLINTQVVSVARPAVYGETKFIETSPGFTGEAWLFSSDYWGNARFAAHLGGGNLNLVMPHFSSHGTERFLNITGDAEVFISTGDVNASTTFVSGGKAGQVSVESSVVALSEPAGYKSWWNNISVAPILQPQATLPRSGWLATASHNNNTANQAIDGNASTRWTAGSQMDVTGQWFNVNMRQQVTFNILILDTSGSPNDWPVEYAVYAYNNPSNMGEPLITGTQQASVLLITLPKDVTAQYVRIVQTGTGRTNYWSIHEFYIVMVDYSDDDDDGEGNGNDNDDDDDNPTFSDNEMNLEKLYPYFSGKTFYFVGYEQIHANATVRIFNAAGQNVLTTNLSGNGISFERLSAGMYIVALQNGNKIITWKIIIAH